MLFLFAYEKGKGKPARRGPQAMWPTREGTRALTHLQKKPSGLIYFTRTLHELFLQSCFMREGPLLFSSSQWGNP
jgi:hypothetical protein